MSLDQLSGAAWVHAGSFNGETELKKLRTLLEMMIHTQSASDGPLYSQHKFKIDDESQCTLHMKAISLTVAAESPLKVVENSDAILKGLFT